MKEQIYKLAKKGLTPSQIGRFSEGLSGFFLVKFNLCCQNNISTCNYKISTTDFCFQTIILSSFNMVSKTQPMPVDVEKKIGAIGCVALLDKTNGRRICIFGTETVNGFNVGRGSGIAGK